MSLIKEKNRKWWTLGSVCFALLMIILDGNVVNLAIPTIIKDFGASISQVEWVNNAYLLVFAIFLITFGRLGDEIGRKKMFITGIIIFLLGSFLCGFAKNIDQLIIFRVIQGLGGASMMPATLSLIAANFEKKERGSAMGLWGAVAGLGIVLGPIIGGYLTDKGLGESLNNLLNISQYWRYVFYINLPIGLIALLASAIFISESKDSEKVHKFDFLGIIISALSIFSLTYAFIEGSKYGWWKAVNKFILFNREISFWGISVIPVLFVLSLLFGIIFVLIEQKCKKDPLVNLRLFKNRNFSVGSVVIAILSFAMMGAFFLLPLFLQSVLGYSSVETGQNLIPFAIAIMIVSPLSGKLADKVGGKYLIMFGLAIMAFGAWLLANFRVDTTINELIIPFVVTGFGMGLCQAPLTNISLLDTPEDQVGGASGVLTTVRQIGSVMGIAILGAVLQTTLITNLGKNLDAVPGMTPVIRQIVIDNGENQYSNQTAVQEQIKNEMLSELSKKTNTTNTVDKSKLTPNQIADTQAQAYKNDMVTKMTKFGQDISNAAKKSFVDSINYTFKIAAIFAIFGSIISLGFCEKKKQV